jgi:methionyl-tRNA formyltransferase
VVAYGKIIPRSLISAPRLSTINAHPSLLPALRGPSPIQTALLQNLTETGVSIILLDEEVDHGPLIAQLPVAILPRDTYVTLLEKLSVSAAKLIAETIIAYANGVIQPIPQNHSAATYTKRFTKRDGVIPWKNPAQTILNRIRALNPWPGTATMWNGKNLAVLEAELFSGGVSLPPGDVSFAKDKLLVGTGTVPLMVKTLRLAGKKTLDAQSFMRGHPSFLKAHLPS